MGSEAITLKEQETVMNAEDDERLVVNQFTQQAAPFREFAEMSGHPRQMVLAAAEIKPDDTVLDVLLGSKG